MKLSTSKDPFAENGFFKLKNQEYLNNQRVAGKIAAKTLLLLENLVKEKTKLSMLDLDKLAGDFIIKSGGEPTFKNYKGFPNFLCISTNKILVHGVCTDYVLQEGDLVSFDLGVTYNGAIADTAITCIYGEPKSEQHSHLVKTTEECLTLAINTISIGKRIGVIGEAIYKHARKNDFSVINNYGGHGICITEDNIGIPHAKPFIANQANSNEGIRIQPGMVIAIEPLLTTGSIETKVLSDGWSVETNNISAHFEHSIYIHEDHVEVISSRNL